MSSIKKKTTSKSINLSPALFSASVHTTHIRWWTENLYAYNNLYLVHIYRLASYNNFTHYIFNQERAICFATVWWKTKHTYAVHSVCLSKKYGFACFDEGPKNDWKFKFKRFRRRMTPNRIIEDIIAIFDWIKSDSIHNHQFHISFNFPEI